MSGKPEFIMAKCPKCGYETPVEQTEEEEGVLDVVFCQHCGALFTEKPSGPSAEKSILLELDDRRNTRNQGILPKIKSWWQNRKK